MKLACFLELVEVLRPCDVAGYSLHNRKGLEKALQGIILILIYIFVFIIFFIMELVCLLPH